MATNQTAEDIQKNINTLNQRIATEGITDNAGKVLVAPTTPANNNVINSETLGNQQSLVNVGEKKTDNSSAGILAGINAQNENFKTSEKEMPDYLKAYLGTAQQAPSLADKYTQFYGAMPTPDELNKYTSEYNTAKTRRNALSAQIQGITAESTQAKLELEQRAGGKDVTTSFLGRQQQEIDRQSAIKALPLQADFLMQQAIVDSNKDLMDEAKGKIDDYFKLVLQDEENTYNYNKELREKVFAYAEKDEQREFDKQQKEDDRNFTLMRENIGTQKDYAKLALESGDSQLMSEINNLSPASKTFQKDLASLSARIKTKPVAKTPSQVKKINYNFERIIKGVGDINTLTPTDRTEVENRLFEEGYYEEFAPDWFEEQVQKGLIESIDTGYQQSLDRTTLKKLWDKYRNPILERLKPTTKGTGDNNSSSQIP